MVKRVIESATPSVLKLILTDQTTFRAAIEEFEKIRPENYTNTILVNMSYGCAWGEIDMCIFSEAERINYIEHLEKAGWEWRK